MNNDLSTTIARVCWTAWIKTSCPPAVMSCLLVELATWWVFCGWGRPLMIPSWAIKIWFPSAQQLLSLAELMLRNTKVRVRSCSRITTLNTWVSWEVSILFFVDQAIRHKIFFYKIKFTSSGAAHGLCSILQALLSVPGFLSSDPYMEKDIRQSVDYLLSLQTPSGNFPCDLSEVGTAARSKDDELVHWCHGAPGKIIVFIKQGDKNIILQFQELFTSWQRPIWSGRTKGTFRRAWNVLKLLGTKACSLKDQVTFNFALWSYIRFNIFSIIKESAMALLAVATSSCCFSVWLVNPTSCRERMHLPNSWTRRNSSPACWSQITHTAYTKASLVLAASSAILQTLKQLHSLSQTYFKFWPCFPLLATLIGYYILSCVY